MSDVNYTHCSEEETKKRVEFCSQCDKMSVEEDGTTKCALLPNLEINLIISTNEISCPKENW